MNSDQENYETLSANASAYMQGFVQAVFGAIDRGELTHESGSNALIAAASVVASELGQPGLEAFCEHAEDIASLIRRNVQPKLDA